MCSTGKKIRAKSSKDEHLEDGVKTEIIAVKGPMAVVSAEATIHQVKSELRRPLNTVDLEELPDSA